MKLRPDSNLPNLRPLCAAIGCAEQWTEFIQENGTELNRTRALRLCAVHDREFREELRVYRMADRASESRQGQRPRKAGRAG